MNMCIYTGKRSEAENKSCACFDLFPAELLPWGIGLSSVSHLQLPLLCFSSTLYVPMYLLYFISYFL